MNTAISETWIEAFLISVISESELAVRREQIQTKLIPSQAKLGSCQIVISGNVVVSLPLSSDVSSDVSITVIAQYLAAQTSAMILRPVMIGGMKGGDPTVETNWEISVTKR